MALIGSIRHGPAELSTLPWACSAQWEHCSAQNVAMTWTYSVPNVALDVLNSLGCHGPARLRRLPWVCWVQWEHCSAPEVAIGMVDSVGALLGLVGCHGHAGLIRCERVSGSSERGSKSKSKREEK